MSAIRVLGYGLLIHVRIAQVSNCSSGVQQAAIPAQSATMQPAATTALLFPIYMQSNKANANNSCEVDIYDSQVRL